MLAAQPKPLERPRRTAQLAHRSVGARGRRKLLRRPHPREPVFLRSRIGDFPPGLAQVVDPQPVREVGNFLQRLAVEADAGAHDAAPVAARLDARDNTNLTPGEQQQERARDDGAEPTHCEEPELPTWFSR